MHNRYQSFHLSCIQSPLQDGKTTETFMPCHFRTSKIMYNISHLLSSSGEEVFNRVYIMFWHSVSVPRHVYKSKAPANLEEIHQFCMTLKIKGEILKVTKLTCIYPTSLLVSVNALVEKIKEKPLFTNFPIYTKHCVLFQIHISLK